MADDGHGHLIDGDEDGNEQRLDGRPIIMRSLGKFPKQYHYGDDFRAFIARFNMYADLNNIANNNRGPLLFIVR